MLWGVFQLWIFAGHVVEAVCDDYEANWAYVEVGAFG